MHAVNNICEIWKLQEELLVKRSLFSLLKLHKKLLTSEARVVKNCDNLAPFIINKYCLLKCKRYIFKTPEIVDVTKQNNKCIKERVRAPKKSRDSILFQKCSLKWRQLFFRNHRTIGLQRFLWKIKEGAWIMRRRKLRELTKCKIKRKIG